MTTITITETPLQEL